MNSININDLRRALNQEGCYPGMLNFIHILDHMNWCDGDFYKIVEVSKDGSIKSLFHGYYDPLDPLSLNKTRKFVTSTWLHAVVKEVRDGSDSPYYTSGFHLFDNLEKCKKYIKRFKPKKDGSYKGVLKVKAKDIWRKEHSKSDVYLAAYMLIESMDIIYDNKKTK